MLDLEQIKAEMLIRKLYICQRCTWKWISKKWPRHCPACHTIYWYENDVPVRGRPRTENVVKKNDNVQGQV